METFDFSKSPGAAHTVTASLKPPGWRLVNFSRSTIQSRPGAPHLKSHGEPADGWSAVQCDFEQRLTHFGIKISETKQDASSNDVSKSTKPTHDKSHATAHSCAHDASQQEHLVNMANDEDFLALKAPILTSFANNKRETKLEATQRQLQQARTEVQIWKERCETQEHDLRVAYGETMKWRMEYEDLYSAIIRGQQPLSVGVQVKRHGTKSLG